MRVLVTGVAGFVGSHLAERLIAEGHEVVGLDAFTPYYAREIKENNLRDLRQLSGFTFFETDLRSGALDAVLDGVDAVVNEAAMPGLPRSWTQFEEYNGCNLLAVQRLIEACRSAGVRRFVQVSTSSVYGQDAVGDERRPTRPVSPYGVTKLAAEQLIQAYVSEFGFPATILRYFSIYGPRQRPDMAYNVFIRLLAEGKPITIYGDGSQSRSNTYVSDAVRGTIQALHEAQIGEVYNIGGGQVVTLLEAIQIIAEALGVIPELVFQDRRAGDQLHTEADYSKASAAFGYAPVVSPEEGLAAQVAWQRAG